MIPREKIIRLGREPRYERVNQGCSIYPVSWRERGGLRPARWTCCLREVTIHPRQSGYLGASVGAISDDRPYRTVIDNRGRMEIERRELILAADTGIDYTSLLPAAEKRLRDTPWDGQCHELRRNHRRTETLAVAISARSNS
jgi:hypothetical protein